MATVLDSKTVKKVAYLARISSNPSPEFLEKYGKDLGEVLNYVKELEEVDVAGINPLDGSRVIFVEDLREDEIDPDQDNYQNIRARIISNFPNKQGNFFVITGIFE